MIVPNDSFASLQLFLFLMSIFPDFFADPFEFSFQLINFCLIINFILFITILED